MGSPQDYNLTLYLRVVPHELNYTSGMDCVIKAGGEEIEKEIEICHHQREKSKWFVSEDDRQEKRGRK